MNLACGSKKVILVSACLLGISCRYDGRSKPAPGLTDMIAGACVVPVCPEQLGGLPTPRPAAEIVNGDGMDVLEGKSQVLTVVEKIDVTEHFLKGAEEAFLYARATKARHCILKSGSPSCGLTPKAGVTAALLVARGLNVMEI